MISAETAADNSTQSAIPHQLACPAGAEVVMRKAKGAGGADKRATRASAQRESRTPFQQLPAHPRRSVTALCRRITHAEREQLLRWVKTKTSPQRLVMRSRIVLLAGEGHGVSEIARRLSVAPATVRLWCERFHRRGVGALEKDAAGRGRRPGMDMRVVVAVLRAMLTTPPKAVWTARSLATAAGTSVSTVWRVWQRCRVEASSSRTSIHEALRKATAEA
jgi:transposase